VASIIAQEVLWEIRKIARSETAAGAARRGCNEDRTIQGGSCCGSPSAESGGNAERSPPENATKDRARHDPHRRGEQRLHRKPRRPYGLGALTTKQSPAGAAIELREITRGARRNAPGWRMKAASIRSSARGPLPHNIGCIEAIFRLK